MTREDVIAEITATLGMLDKKQEERFLSEVAALALRWTAVRFKNVYGLGGRFEKQLIRDTNVKPPDVSKVELIRVPFPKNRGVLAAAGELLACEPGQEVAEWLNENQDLISHLRGKSIAFTGTVWADRDRTNRYLVCLVWNRRFQKWQIVLVWLSSWCHTTEEWNPSMWCFLKIAKKTSSV